MDIRDIKIDRYMLFDELKEAIEAVKDYAPEIVELKEIGKTFQGREVFLLEITDRTYMAPDKKPGFYADACTHAEEFSGCNALLKLVLDLVNGYKDGDPDILDSLKYNTYYIVPRLNPDGIEAAMMGNPWCGNGRFAPGQTQLKDGFYWEDIDSNGVICNMRKEDPDGEWKISEKDPRLMTLRKPGEKGGAYYRLYPEGRIRGDVKNAGFQKPTDGNINRNYPGLWTPDAMQYGAGELPMSEPETKAVMDFFVSHRNIAMVFSLHTNAGVVLRPFTNQSDKHFKGRDKELFMNIGAIGTEELGYPVVSVFEEFTPEAEGVRGGTLNDYTYLMKGIPTIVIEQWNVGKESGCGIDDPYPPDYLGEDAEIKVLKWAEEHLGEKAYIDYREYGHPELGKVEIGGFNRIRVFRNPPEDYLYDLSARTARVAMRLAECMPRMDLKDICQEHLSGDYYKITATVRNSGYLPTYLTAQAREVHDAEKVFLKLEGNAEIVCESDRDGIEGLEGRFGRNSEWSQWIYPWEAIEKTVSFVVKADLGTKLMLSAGNSRSGIAQKELIIKNE